MYPRRWNCRAGVSSSLMEKYWIYIIIYKCALKGIKGKWKLYKVLNFNTKKNLNYNLIWITSNYELYVSYKCTFNWVVMGIKILDWINQSVMYLHRWNCRAGVSSSLMEKSLIYLIIYKGVLNENECKWEVYKVRNFNTNKICLQISFCFVLL